MSGRAIFKKENFLVRLYIHTAMAGVLGTLGLEERERKKATTSYTYTSCPFVKSAPKTDDILSVVWGNLEQTF